MRESVRFQDSMGATHKWLETHESFEEEAKRGAKGARGAGDSIDGDKSPRRSFIDQVVTDVGFFVNDKTRTHSSPRCRRLLKL